MFSALYTGEIIALSFLFLLSSIWSEDNVRFGYVVTPLFAGLLWIFGLIPFVTGLGTAMATVVFMGVISFYRSQAKYKYGVFGTAGGILYKVVFFLIILQLSIGYVNSMATFTVNGNPLQTVATQQQLTSAGNYQTYNLQSANQTFSNIGGDTSAWSALFYTVQLPGLVLNILINMLGAIFFIYPTLITVFGVPPALGAMLQAGIYVIYGLELINIIFRPFKPIEV
jgi:hypothetical protein